MNIGWPLYDDNNIIESMTSLLLYSPKILSGHMLSATTPMNFYSLLAHCVLFNRFVCLNLKGNNYLQISAVRPFTKAFLTNEMYHLHGNVTFWRHSFP